MPTSMKTACSFISPPGDFQFSVQPHRNWKTISRFSFHRSCLWLIFSDFKYSPLISAALFRVPLAKKKSNTIHHPNQKWLYKLIISFRLRLFRSLEFRLRSFSIFFLCHELSRGTAWRFLDIDDEVSACGLRQPTLCFRAHYSGKKSKRWRDLLCLLHIKCSPNEQVIKFFEEEEKNYSQTKPQFPLFSDDKWT